MPDDTSADLVLVGGGHAHVQVLRRWMMRPLAGVRVTVVLDRPDAVYSGMVPGFVAGDYAAPELEIDLVPLARRARARVVLAPATRVDAAERRIELEGRSALAYDVASLDVGSGVRELELPGVLEHALATRPIRQLIDRLEPRLAALARGDGPARIAIVGGGAAGLELAFSLCARLGAAGLPASLCVLAASSDVLPGYPARVARAARREAERRGVRIRCGARVVAVEKDGLRLGGGEAVSCDLAVWATGAAAHAWLRASPLPCDAEGFVRVRSTLEVSGCDALFAVGDCAALEEHPWVPRAGVYAVREGPLLDHNLRAKLAGRALRGYRPQRDFLTLLNLGGRRALGAKWGAAFAGGWVWRWKDRIDRRFVRRFQVLGPSGEPAPDFPSAESMGMPEMPCGGCAAKVGDAALQRALARLAPPPEDASVLLGLARPDDAAALSLPGGDVMLASIDGFRAFGDDPWLVGRVAAVNAASDVYAKGGRPRHALALVTVPDADPGRAEETLFQVVAGVRAALDPLGISLVGGHSTSGTELFVALSITGELGAAEDLLALGGARCGDHLVLSKALGTGVILAADMQGLATGAWVQGAIASMLRANDAAARVARALGAHACTDVSGFGLAGHLGALLRASDASASLRLEALPRLDGAFELLARGLRSSFHGQNAAARPRLCFSPAAAQHPLAELLFDPQTSGGLLFAVEAARSADALRALREAGDVAAAVIGEVTPPRADGARFAVTG